MVPHIPAIAMNTPEFTASVPTFDAHTAVSPNLADRAAFAGDPSSPGVEWITRVEERSKESEVNLDNEMKRVMSGNRLLPADMLRLRSQINMNTESHLLYKKIADSVVQGVQTLARG
jgi:hypothetical protein